MESLELYIEIDENGQPVNHPILGENFRLAFPNIDTNNLPSKFEKFQRNERPVEQEGEKVSETPVYQKINGIWQDVWIITKNV